MTHHETVHHPQHYGAERFGCECIEFTRHMTFAAGNAFKYLWRHVDKGNPSEDLAKALVYVAWAAEDYARYHTGAILPGRSGVVTGLYRRHLEPNLADGRNPGFHALRTIIWDNHAATRLHLEDRMAWLALNGGMA